MCCILMPCGLDWWLGILLKEVQGTSAYPTEKGKEMCPFQKCFKRSGYMQQFLVEYTTKITRFHPIGSMHGMLIYIYPKNQRNVGKYTSPMGPMGRKWLRYLMETTSFGTSAFLFVI